MLFRSVWELSILHVFRLLMWVQRSMVFYVIVTGQPLYTGNVGAVFILSSICWPWRCVVARLPAIDCLWSPAVSSSPSRNNCTSLYILVRKQSFPYKDTTISRQGYDHIRTRIRPFPYKDMTISGQGYDHFHAERW